MGNPLAPRRHPADDLVVRPAVLYPNNMGSHISSAPAGHSRQVLDSIRRIVQLLRESSHEAGKHGLSGAQLFVLRTLAESPGLSLNELAERTRTHQSSVSVVVARLVEHGLVERAKAPHDARRMQLKLSADGVDRIRSAPRTAQERLVAAIDALPQAARARLASVLDTLVRDLDLGGAHPHMFFHDSARRPQKARLADA
jgi:MarR family transcriptional regulator, lower aerobic nicotinate degradation pathway regulator